MKSLIVIISNPEARGSSLKKIRMAQDFFKKRGFSSELLFTEQAGHAQELARMALDKRPFMIIAAGGDGTINEVINGIVYSEIPLGILPMGTTNVLARELGIPFDIYKASEFLLTNKAHTVSLGNIEYSDNLSFFNRYFCLMAGIGFDGKIVHDVNLSLKKISGKTAYILSGIVNLLNYHPDEIFFNVDGIEYSGYAAIIGKQSRYGGNFKVTPDVSLQDPFLYACIFTGKRRRDILRYVFEIITGRHLKEKDVIYKKASRIEVIGKTHIQIDGDYLGTSPADISVKKDTLKIIY